MQNNIIFFIAVLSNYLVRGKTTRNQMYDYRLYLCRNAINFFNEIQLNKSKIRTLKKITYNKLYYTNYNKIKELNLDLIVGRNI